MRHFAPLLIVLPITANADVSSAQGAEPNAYAASAASSTAAALNRSDVEILAERHLALYRAARLPHQNGSVAASPADSRDVAAAIVKTAGTAALPFPLIFPPNPSNEQSHE